jgi:hypothetical protein
MTGRRAGYCAGNTVPGYANPGPGWSFGRRFGRGFGRGFRGRGFARGWGDRWGLPYGAAPTADEELDVLKNEAESLAGALEDIKKRIGELEADKKRE